MISVQSGSTPAFDPFSFFQQQQQPFFFFQTRAQTSASFK
jgi:hypothetical protein